MFIFIVNLSAILIGTMSVHITHIT